MRTLAILKPDAIGSDLTGKILAHLEAAGFHIVAAHTTKLTRDEAEGFYEIHRARPFFSSLVAYMTSGPCMPLVLEHERAVEHLRKVIGATDPAEAEDGTIRKLYAESKERNAIHASDSEANAAAEIAFFFSTSELKRISP
jgi:nucleoside-diphosphate kinase